MGAASEMRKVFIMAIIGNFKKSGNELKGSIITLSVQAKNVRIVPEDNRASDNTPSHRVFVGEVEIGAGWAKRTNDNRPYLSLKIDDPSFTAPIFTQLFEGDEGVYDLVWSRPRRGGE